MTMTPNYRRPVKPTPKPCPDCGRKVLAGLDGRAAALPVVIDADILTREGELVNIVKSVKMYATNPQGEILRRTAGEILHHVAMLDIHRVHDCEQPTPPAFIKPLPKKPAAIISEDVPF
jgi:hypothetical protein